MQTVKGMVMATQPKGVVPISFRRMAEHFVCAVAMTASLSGAAGCASSARAVTRDATPGAIQGGIDVMESAATRNRIARILASPEVYAIEREAIAGLTDSALATLTEQERAERIGALTTKMASAILRGAAREAGPAAAEVSRGVMEGALSAAFRPGRGRAVEGAAGALITTSVRSAAEGLREAEIGAMIASALTEELGPALERTLRDDLGPGLAEVLKNEELNRALGATARAIGREMVIGAQEGLSKAEPPREPGSVLGRASDLASKGARLFGSLAWVLFLIIGALAAWIAKLLVQARRYRAEADRRAATSRP